MAGEETILKCPYCKEELKDWKGKTCPECGNPLPVAVTDTRRMGSGYRTS